MSLDTPALRNGKDTAAPSGKFCSPIPIASAIAAGMVADLKPSAAAPNATPIASPSGMLWRVIANTNNVDFLQGVSTPSASSIFSPGWRWGRNLSMTLRVMPPDRKPIAAGSQGIMPCMAAYSIEGANRDQKLAAIMTPAPKPSIASSSFRFIVFVKKTKAAPAAVTNQVNSVASSAW